MVGGPRQHLPSLEGIRAYAFLLVFAVHFSGTSWNLQHRPFAAYPWLLLQQLSFVAVPIFFALSGYLITGILVDTREKLGFLRVFYLRRAIRIFPLYYITLFTIFMFLHLHAVHLELHHALFLVYLQNLWPGVTIYRLSPRIYIAHLWSLAVEEQFYALWPLIIWLFADRRSLLRFSYAVIGLAFLARVWAAFAHIDPGTSYQNTLFRSDAIMLGAILALHERGPMKDFAKISRSAKYVVLCVPCFLVVRALLVGQALPYDAFGLIVVTPLLALVGTAIVVLALTPGNLIHSASTKQWAVDLGKLSYGLYVIHQLLAPYFLEAIVPKFVGILGNVMGQLAGMTVAFAIVYAISRLAFVVIEKPAMSLKARIRYGSELEKSCAVPPASHKTLFATFNSG